MESLAIADTRKSSARNDAEADDTSAQPTSAIATFCHNLNSKRPHSESPSTPKPELVFARSCAFPMELLLLIFRCAFEACVDWEKTPKEDTYYPEHKIVWIEEDPLSPSLFPYALASVCVEWLYILSKVSIYWTRQVVLVDSHALSPVVIQWADDFPLQLIITAHHDPGTSDTDGEARAVSAVVDLLRPECHRIWSLTYDVRHSSSLPTLWREQGGAECLCALTLKSSRSNKLRTMCLPQLPKYSNGNLETLGADFMREVTLGGHFFNDVLMNRCLEFDPWFHKITSLTISGYATSLGSGMSLHWFFSSILRAFGCYSLRSLTIEDIAFDNDLDCGNCFGFGVVGCDVYLRKLSGKALGSIMSYILPHDKTKGLITVADCPFDGFETGKIPEDKYWSTNLTLEGVNSCVGINDLVRLWMGKNLSLVNCPGMSDRFLHVCGPDGIKMDIPHYLCRLRIVDCKNVAVDKLMYLVKWKKDRAKDDIPGKTPYAELVELHIQGRGPSISIEEAKWFAAHVETFYWDTVASDETRYSYPASAGGLVVTPPNV